MHHIFALTICLLLAYLCGSIPFGKIVARHYNVDIQKSGSGNIGFANAARVLGLKPGLVVLAGDVLKGFLPTILAVRILSFNQALFVGLVAILAHIFPVWLHFKGGKGIATGLGITLALAPLVGALGFAIYLLIFMFVRKSAPASVGAAWSLVLFSFLCSSQYIIFAVVLALLATWTHRKNLTNHLESRRAAH